MTLYNVHIYREMRLFFPGIEAAAAEEAAQIASEKSTADAEYTEDCDGESLGALVDVVGDTTFEQSQMIDFEAEQLRKAGPTLLAVLVSLKMALEHHGTWPTGMPEYLLGVINDALGELTNSRRAV